MHTTGTRIRSTHIHKHAQTGTCSHISFRHGKKKRLRDTPLHLQNPRPHPQQWQDNTVKKDQLRSYQAGGGKKMDAGPAREPEAFCRFIGAVELVLPA